MDDEIMDEMKGRLKKIAILFVPAVFLTPVLSVETSSFRGVTIPYLWPSYKSSVSVDFFRYVETHLVPKNVETMAIHPIGGFGMIMKVSILLGVLITLPYAIYHIVAFVSPALLKKEKSILKKSMIPVTGLFFGGALFSFFVFLPVMYRFLYNWTEWLGVAGKLTLTNLASFTISIMIVSGLIWELPVLMIALSKMGVMPAEKWDEHKLEAGGILTILCMMAPGGLGVSIFLIIPMLGLFFTGLYVSKKLEGGDT